MKLQVIYKHIFPFDVIKSTNSVKSIISKPFVQRIAILAFKKIRSKDSEGKKKSCNTWSGRRRKMILVTSYPIDSEPL